MVSLISKVRSDPSGEIGEDRQAQWSLASFPVFFFCFFFFFSGGVGCFLWFLLGFCGVWGVWGVVFDVSIELAAVVCVDDLRIF